MRAPAATKLNNVIAELQASEAQSFGEAMFHLGQNKGPNI